MHLIEITPQPCMVCGSGNTPGPNGERRQFIDLERDTFWDDPAIICEDCGLKIAGLLGTPSPEELQRAAARISKLTTQAHDLKVEIDSMKRRARKLGISFVPEEAEVA